MKQEQFLKRLLFAGVMALCSVMTVLAQFSGPGSGTEEDPYRITTVTQLSQMANFLGNDYSKVVFQLENDLDLTDWIAQNSPRQGWMPIGVSESSFCGTFLGQNHTIKGLMINRPTTDYVGFFGYMTGTVKDLTLEVTSLKGRSYVGCIAGRGGRDGGIENCHVRLTNTMEVSNGQYAGGIIGWSIYGTLKNCSFSGDIKGSNYQLLGGIAGQTHYPVTNCNVDGYISCSGKYVGGVVGRAYCGYGGLYSCSMKGDITVEGHYVGGIVGGGDPALETCKYDGNIKGDSCVGGLIGGIPKTEEKELHRYELRVANRNSDGSAPSFSSSKYWKAWIETVTFSNETKERNVINCSASGSVFGKVNVGGLIGHDMSSIAYNSEPHDIYIHDYDNYKEYYFLLKDGERIKQGAAYDTGFSISYHTYTAYYQNSLLNNCVFSGNVQGTENIGGLVGLESGGILKSNLSYAIIEGNDNVGGIIGKIDNASYSYSKETETEVSSNVAVNPTITVSNSNIGRIYGFNTTTNASIGATGTVKSNRASNLTIIKQRGYEKEVDDNLQNGTGTTPISLKMRDNYIAWGWDFSNYWNIVDEETYPYLKYQAAPPVIKGSLEGGMTSVSGTSYDGGTVYLLYNNLNEPASAVCEGIDFTINTQPLKGESVVLLYAENGGKRSYYTMANVGKDPSVKVTSIILQAIANLKVGESKQWSAKVYPTNATDKSVTWTSSDTNIATVSNTGLVTAVAVGKATITCTANDGSGVKASCPVTVSSPIPVADVHFVSVVCDNNNLDALSKNDKLMFHATFTNYGDKDSIATAIMICDKEVTRIVARGDIEWMIIDTNQEITLDYEYALDTIPNGEYTATVVFFDWNEESWIYIKKFLIPITITDNNSSLWAQGDVNMDDAVNGTDLVALSNIVLGRKDKNETADVNGDGNVNGTDLVALSNIILGRNKAPQRTMSIANGLSVEPKNRAPISMKLFKNSSLALNTDMTSRRVSATGAMLSIEPFNIKAGEVKEMLIDLSNPNDEVTLVQFDLHLPTGLSIKKNGSDLDIDMAGRTSWRKHTLDANEINGAYRFLLYSSGNTLIEGTGGAIIKVNIVADESFNGGKIVLDNILLVDPNEKETKPEAVEYVISGSMLEPAPGDAYLSIEPFDIATGETKEMQINLTNPNNEVTLVQFDLHLPAGLSIKKSGSNFDFDMAGRTSWRKHTLDANEVDGAYRFLLYSSSNTLIEGTSGAIIKVNIVADESFNGGKIVLDNILLVDPNEKETKPKAYEYVIPTPDDGSAKLSIEPFDIAVGETKEMLIDLLNPNDEVTLVQFDLHLPASLSIKKNGSDLDFDMSGRTSWRKHTLDANEVDGAYRFLLYSSSNTLIEGTSGAIIQVNIVANESFNGGKVVLDNILLVDPNEKEMKPARYEYEIGSDSGISTVMMDAVGKNARIYNLSGQKLAAPQKGINIIGGKKVVVK